AHTTKKNGSPQTIVKQLMLLTGLLLMIRLITLPSFSLYIEKTYSTDYWVIGLIYGLQAMGVILSAQLWAKWFEHQSIVASLTRLRWIIFGCAAIAVSLANASIIWFALLYFIWGILLGATTPILTALISSASPAEHQGYVLGLSQSINQFASIGGISLGSILIIYPGINMLFYYISVGYLICLSTIILLTKHIINKEQYEKKV
ncbi:MFS transporter, partial [Providencia stuartii]